MNGSACLTDTVKNLVQSNSMGLLSGSTGMAYIKVNYFSVPAPGSTAPTTDVSSQATADSSGNIMQVSVQGVPVQPLMPLLGLTNATATTSYITVYSSDIIEPNTNPPCVGVAP
jgi:hypothetical protein